jgi:hypothetical protein
MSLATEPDYFRQDQDRGITAPNLAKRCDFAEHIVHARGKKTAFTSVSLDRDKIDDFGPTLYLALRSDIVGAGHALIEHADLIASLRESAASLDKAGRQMALRAIPYAKRRKEGLIDWKFDLSSVA